jgi:hypothetical protein
MKKLILPLISVLLFSCSSDNETVAEAPILNNTTFVNLTTNNFWKYRIETKTGTAATVVAPTIDHLKVGSDAVINGITYKNMEAVGAPVGFYVGVMDEKKLRKFSDELQFTGNISLELGNNIPTQTIPVENFKIFKESATNALELSSKNGSLAPIPLSLPLNGTTVNGNVLVDYSFKSFGGETFDTFTAPLPNSGTAATTYNNVKSVRFVLNVKMKFSYVLVPGYPAISIDLLNPVNQDIIVSTNYYAKDKGVVYTQTNTNLTFANALGSTTPIAPPIVVLQREYLTDFINN